MDTIPHSGSSLNETWISKLWANDLMKSLSVLFRSWISLCAQNMDGFEHTTNGGIPSRLLFFIRLIFQRPASGFGNHAHNWFFGMSYMRGTFFHDKFYITLLCSIYEWMARRPRGFSPSPFMRACMMSQPSLNTPMRLLAIPRLHEWNISLIAKIFRFLQEYIPDKPYLSLLFRK